MKKNWKIILLVVVIIGAIVFYFGMKEYNRGAADVTDKKADITIQATELTKAFGDDEAKANSMYLDKAVAVSGTVAAVEQDDKGAYTIMLNGDSALSNVSCQLDERHNDDGASVKEGDNITIKGFCTGMLMDVVLIRCAVDK